MQSKHDLNQPIQSHVTRLVQAVVDAEFWHDRWLEQAGQEHHRCVSAAEARYEQGMSKAQGDYESVIPGVVEDTEAVFRSAGLLAAP